MIYGGGFINWVKALKDGDETYAPIDIKNEKQIQTF